MAESITPRGNEQFKFPYEISDMVYPDLTMKVKHFYDKVYVCDLSEFATRQEILTVALMNTKLFIQQFSQPMIYRSKSYVFPDTKEYKPLGLFLGKIIPVFKQEIYALPSVPPPNYVESWVEKLKDAEFENQIEWWFEVLPFENDLTSRFMIGNYSDKKTMSVWFNIEGIFLEKMNENSSDWTPKT